MILDEKMEKYISRLHGCDPKCEFLIAEARKNNVPIVTNEVAELLKVLITSGKYKKICEFGCGYGHSTFSIASVMDEDTCFHSVDSSTGSIGFVSKELKRRQNEASDPKEKTRLGNIQMCHETALSFLSRMKKEGQEFDFLFVDAVKKEYQEYLDLILSITKPGAMIVFDNILWKGGVAEDSPSGKSIPLIAFNQSFMNEPQIQSAILPVGDGIAIGIRR